MKSSICAIPGFLGLATDWDVLNWKEISGVDPWIFNWNSLTDWAQHFNQWIRSQDHPPAILMGYSMGGRLALHALIENPQQWKAAIIVSSHPGLTHFQEREERRLQDEKWAERFEKEEWKGLMQAWNARDVFAHDGLHFHRQEHDYQRQQLKQALRVGSLAEQADLRPPIASLPMPILWITGSRDERYSQIAQELTFNHSNSRKLVVEGAGHRIPWAQPIHFTQLVQAFLSVVSDTRTN